MPCAEFFTRFGLFARHNFLETEWCARVCAEMLEDKPTPATVWMTGQGFVVSPEARRTTFHKVSARTMAFVEDRLRGLQGELARHFNVRLTGCRKPGFLSYGPGGFHRPHRDSGSGPTFPATIRERRVSVVVFLNGESVRGRAGTYRGGALTFYGLFDDPRLAGYGLPLEGESGLMVAFPADVLHQVASVSEGVRHTIVTWFFEAEAPLP